jgi:hypothetical protein
MMPIEIRAKGFMMRFVLQHAMADILQKQNVLFVYDGSDEETDESFERKCKRISRSEPTIRAVDAVSHTYGYHIWFGYGRPLGKALLSNTVVNRIDLATEFFFTHHRLKDSRREKEAAPMLQYLRTSSTLRTVRLATDCNIEDADWSDMYEMEENDIEVWLSGKILLSLAQNPNIDTFVSTVELPVAEFVQFLSATAVHTVRLEQYATVRFHDAALLADAFVMNHSIRYLHLNCSSDSHSAIELIVWRLDERDKGSSTATNGRPAIEVTVEVSEPASLTALLKTTLVLQTLILKRIRFDEQRFAQLCDALALNASVTKLGLRKCKFTPCAAATLVDLFQTKVNRGANKLRTLRVDAVTQSSPFLPEMLVGSALHSLELEGNVNVASFLHQVATSGSAARIGLQCLTLNVKKPLSVDFQSLTRYLAQTVVLRELYLGGIWRHGASRQVTVACRSNGSLVHVRMEGYLDENVSLESYCARNANLPTLLAGYCDGGSGQERTSEALSLVPSLLSVAQHATRTATSTILLGLLALSDSLADERSGALRKRS